MIKTRIYLDTRGGDKEGLHSLYLVLSKSGSTAMTALNIKLTKEQWEGGQVVKHPKKAFLNNYLSIIKGNISQAILQLSLSGSFSNKTARESLDAILYYIDPEREAERIRKAKHERLFAKYYLKHINTIPKDSTRRLYNDTYRKIEGFCLENGSDINEILLDDINNSWLVSFESFCLKNESQNTAGRHLRDIRAVFNAAIDDGLTHNYPFRKFKIKKSETKDKSYSAEELRRLFSFESTVPGEQESIDIFKLMFCLIGINSVDLAYCEKDLKGRIQYIRRKTGKLYDIKLEPEARAIINKYRGNEHLVNLLERVPNYKTYFRRMDKNLKKAGMTQVPGKKSEGEILLPGISSGAARTSWATIAQEELDIPRDVIAAALGHHTVDVTSTYLRTEWRKKVDEANRKVLDWVFYKKKGLKSEE